MGHFNLIHGAVRDENLEDINALQTNDDGSTSLSFSTLDGSTPYIEVGYGIENILKVFRISAFHRLTYTGLPNTNDFGIKFGLQLTL